MAWLLVLALALGRGVTALAVSPAVAPVVAPKAGVAARPFEPDPGDVASVEGWPSIGKWMLDRHLRPASWLGTLYRGKLLREPINVVIVDAFARTADEATQRLLRSCRAAGYQVREGHSSGYRAYIGGSLYGQLPAGKGQALANHPFEIHNNHGRVFGPVKVGEGWLFIGAFSRERLVPFSRGEHRFMSFFEARDHFARRLDDATDFKIAGFIDLGNAVVGDAAVTTADHDGRAVVLKAQR